MRHSRIFIVLFLTLFVAMLGAGVIAPTMPLYASTMGAAGIGLGLIYASFSISRAVFMPLAGKLSDRRGRKTFIVTGLAIYTLASIGYVWSHSVPHLIWIRFMHGLGSAMIVPIAAAAIGDIAPKGEEGATMGTFNMALFLGFGAGPLLGGLVLDAAGMLSVFCLMGGLSLLSLVSIAVFLPEEKKETVVQDRIVTPFRSLWRFDTFKGLLIFRFSNAVCRGSLTAFLPIFATRMNVSPSQIGFLVSLNILLTGLLQHVFGRIADRINRKALIVSGNILTALPLLLTPLADRFSHLIVLGVCMGIGSGLAFPAATAVVTEIGRDHGMGNLMGFFNQSMSLGMIVGPMISGWIMDLFGLSVVFISGGVAGVAGSLICGYLLMHKQKDKYHADV